MYMVSIQGAHARSLAIPQKRIRAFESAVNAIVGSDAFFIFSDYRSDIIYHGTADHNPQIIALWQMYADKANGSSLSRSFFQSRGKKDSLEAFFVRLVYLSANKRWFDKYVTSLRRTLSVRSSHRISNELTECQKYIDNEGIHKIFEIALTPPQFPDPLPGIPEDITREYLDEYPVN